MGVVFGKEEYIFFFKYCEQWHFQKLTIDERTMNGMFREFYLENKFIEQTFKN